MAAPQCLKDTFSRDILQSLQLHDAMLSAIFKSVFEDTVPDSAVGIYSSGEKDRMGCDIPKVIEFRSLPVVVQDDLMRAEILPTMWPRYRISGHERMFHYCLMTVTRRQMLKEASCHSLSDIGIENMYPSVTDKKHRDWINSLMSSPDGPADAVDQLILAAFECAVSILREAGSPVMFVVNFNAYRLDLFLFKDVGIDGILAKFITRMNDPEIGGYEGYFLPEPTMTLWWETLSRLMSRWLMQKALVRVMVKAKQQRWMIQLQLPRQEDHWRLLVYPAHPPQHQGLSSEQRHHLASLPSRMSSRMSTTRHLVGFGQLSRAFLSRFSSVKRLSLPIGSTQLRCTATPCGQTTSMQGRHVTVQVRGLISRSIHCSLARSTHMQRTTPRLLFQAFCRTLMTTSWVTMTRLWRTSTGLWMTIGTQSPSHQSSLRVTCRSFCFLQIVMSSEGSELKQQVLQSQPLDKTSEVRELSLRLRSSVTGKVSRSMS